jgi:hypothetical protein
MVVEAHQVLTGEVHEMTAGDLRNRAAGESLMLALRSAMANERPQTRTDTLLGRHPVPAASRSWYVGIIGELDVARVLRTLPDEWLVVHSVPVGNKGSDIDHVVVSPTGRVLTLNTKHSPGGKVWVSPRAFLVNGQRQPYLRNSQHEAERAAKLVGAAAGGHVATLGVIVVVGATLVNKGTPPGIAVVTVNQLKRFLASGLRPEPSGVSVELVRHAVAQASTWTRSVEVPDASGHIPWFMDLRARVNAARRRRIEWFWGILVACVSTPVLFSVLLGFA